MGENAVVPEALDHTNYKVWSKCMKMYLLGQDLWDIIEPEAEQEEEESKTWRKKNALALHAIHMSCGKATLSTIVELESAKEAWDLLRSTNISHQQNLDHDSDTKVQSDDSSGIEQVEDEVDDIDRLFIMNMNVTGEDYSPFEKAVRTWNWRAMKEFLDSHPEANTKAVLPGGRTALHWACEWGNIEIGRLLVDQIERIEDLQILDKEGCTAFAYLAANNKPGVLKLLQHMVARNASLPNIGNHYTTPIIKASWKGFKDTTRYLYSVTDNEILNPEHNIIGVKLVINCINIRLFDIASEIVTKYPKTLQKPNNEGIYPIHALAKSFSAFKSGTRHKKSRVLKFSHWLSKSWKYVRRLHLLAEEEEEDMVQVLDDDNDERHAYDRARAFLRLVCTEVSRFDATMLPRYVYAAMIEASRHGIVEFVGEMLVANSRLCNSYSDNISLFWQAVENRHEKIYSFIYCFSGEKDRLLSHANPEKNNILHLVAKLAPPAALDRTAGPALQMQRELQWFKEVWSLAKPRYREDLNIDGLTPAALFTKTHADLIDAGEKAMKDTAQSSTVVGALIFTVMFAAAFTVPGGNNPDTGLPVFLRRALFRTFIVSDALSLYSSTTSVLVFLGILTSRYAEDDFYLRLPRKLMIGLTTLLISIVTMMISFCMALALMLDGHLLRYILPTVLLAGVPVIIFMSSIVPVLSEMFMSTFGPSIFDRSGKLLENKDNKKVSEESSNNQTSVHNKELEEKVNMMTYEKIDKGPSSMDRIV